MNHPVLDGFLSTQGVVVLDGALATELERRGADLNDPLWSARLLIENPGLIEQVHTGYLWAGADVITTASYQASFAGFARRGLSQPQSVELMHLSVRLACAARDRFWSDPAQQIGRMRPLVAASIGPYGAFLADGSEYRGDYGLTVEELIDWHRLRLAVLAGSGADLLACETIPCRTEGEALVRLLAEHPHMPAWLSFSCRDNAHLASGESFADCVAVGAASEQIVAVGLNCTAPRHVEDLLRIARTVTAKPLVCYPNSGEEWDAVRKCWFSEPDATDFATLARRWYAAGARLIGGCCRTTPSDIRTMRPALLNTLK